MPFKDRTGEKFTNNQGYQAVIEIYHSAKNCTIRYDDNTIVENVKVSQLKSGEFRKPFNRVGEKYKTNEGCDVEIVNYNNSLDVDIYFINYNLVLKGLKYHNVKSGFVRNPLLKSTQGIGYYGIGNYDASDKGIGSKAYSIWSAIFHRCYSENRGDRCSTYKDVTVCEEWYNFQNFAEWFEENHVDGWQVDKDILSKDIKMYSPKTCCFVPSEINNLLLQSDRIRGNYPLGVHKDGERFRAAMKIGNGKILNLGRRNTPEEAFELYKAAKESRFKSIADKWKGQIKDKVYEALYQYEVKPY